MQGEIRNLVRQILSEELAKLKGEMAAKGSAPAPKVREEQVRIASDADLASFVRRLLEITRDGQARREIEQGRWVFRLGTPSGEGRRVGSPAAPRQQSVRIDKGFVSERQVDALPEGTTAIEVTKAVRFTPLARDRLRQRGIAIERTVR